MTVYLSVSNFGILYCHLQQPTSVYAEAQKGNIYFLDPNVIQNLSQKLKISDKKHKNSQKNNKKIY